MSALCLLVSTSCGSDTPASPEDAINVLTVSYDMSDLDPATTYY